MAGASSLGDTGSPSRDGPGSPGQDPPRAVSQIHPAALPAVMSPQGRKGGDSICRKCGSQRRGMEVVCQQCDLAYDIHSATASEGAEDEEMDEGPGEAQSIEEMVEMQQKHIENI